MFADDTTISAIVPDPKYRNSVSNVLSDDLDHVGRWAKDWLVTFNAKKTQCMTISRKVVKDDNKLLFLGEVLNEVNSIKLLGININKTLNWGGHVDKIAKRAGQMLGILRKSRKLLPISVLGTLYKCRVRSVMEYCGPIWQNAPKCFISKLDSIQRKACRIIGVNGDTCPQMNIHSLQHRRNVSGLAQFHRMVNGVAPKAVSQLLPLYRQPTRISRLVAQSHHLQLTMSRSRTEHHRKSFVPNFTGMWNALPTSCLFSSNGDTLDLQHFKININKYLLSQSCK